MQVTPLNIIMKLTALHAYCLHLKHVNEKHPFSFFSLLYSIRSQIFAVLFISLSSVLEYPLSQDLTFNSKCYPSVVQNEVYCNTSMFEIIDDTPQDMTNVVYVYMALVVVTFLYMVIFFKPKYMRTESDKNGEARSKRGLLLSNSNAHL